MAIHSSILAWRIPWTEEPGGLQSIKSQCQTGLSMRAHTHSRRIPETDLEFMRSNRERSDKGGPSHNMEMVVPFHWRRDLKC